MHGLNTVQSVAYSDLINVASGAGSFQYAPIQFYVPGSPADLNNLLNVQSTWTGSTQAWLKRYYRKVTYFNVNHIPVICEVTKLRARRDLISSEALIGIMNQNITTNQTDYPVSNTPWVSPWTGDTFRKSYKIISYKHYTLRPNYPRSFILPVQRNYLGKAISALDEGDTNYTIRLGNLVYVFRFYGVPINYTNTGTPPISNATVLSPLFIRGIVRTYCSYYMMDDTTPNSYINVTIPTVSAGTNIALNPSHTCTVHPSNVSTGNPTDDVHVMVDT